jgi:hypothetical protein
MPAHKINVDGYKLDEVWRVLTVYMKDYCLLILIVSNAGGGNPKTALKPLLTNRSLSLATISLALLVTLGSCESLRMRGANLFTASMCH